MKEDIKLLLGYIKKFLGSKRLIFFCVVTALLLGVLQNVFSDSVYEAKTSFISKSENASGGSGLKSIAALIGVNVGSGSQGFKDIPVSLYPKLKGSVTYNKKLLSTKIRLVDKDTLTTTVRTYITENREQSIVEIVKKYTIGLPGRILKSFRKESNSKDAIQIENLEYLSKKDKSLMKYLQEQIVLKIDAGDGSLHISATDNNALVAAQLAQKAKEILQELIIEYRIGKLQESYDFIEAQYFIKKTDYEAARAALAYYTDRNRFNNTAASLIRKKDLEKKSSLAYSLFTELESQKINSQISLKEETPIFTTIDPSVIPLESLNPSLIISIIKFGIIGLFLAIVIFIMTIYIKIVNSAWKEV